jgi:glycosyltransferase involved in cell wall biosynthesis
VLVFAYTPVFITATTILLGLKGRRLMLRAETTDEALQRSSLKDKVRQLVLTNYYKQFSHVFPIGTNSVQHYRRMGVADGAMTVARYAIDVDFFQKQVDHWLPQREALRAAMGIGPADQVLMYCGKMFEPKHPLLIVQALALLPTELKQRLWLLAVGDGVLRAEFEAGAKAELGERAVFVGFKNQSVLGQYYATADTLVLPSQSGETWGLVVNEALQLGLRVIASDKVGSSRDLISSEAQGYRFSSGNPKALAAAIATVVQYSPVAESVLLPHPDNLAEAIYLRLEIL